MRGCKEQKTRKIFLFSKQPLYSINTIVVGRADESSEIHSLDDLVQTQSVASSVYGTNTYKLLSGQEGLLLGPMPKDPEAGLALVEKGHARFFVYHDLGILYGIKQSGKESLFKVQPAVLRHYSHWMMYSPHLEENTRNLIEDELQILHTQGVIQEIMTSYISQPGTSKAANPDKTGV